MDRSDVLEAYPVKRSVFFKVGLDVLVPGLFMLALGSIFIVASLYSPIPVTCRTWSGYIPCSLEPFVIVSCLGAVVSVVGAIFTSIGWKYRKIEI